jgi:hypothetical protein
MKGKWIHVFKSGIHTPMNGDAKTFTESDIDQIVTKYNEQSDHEAPLVIGHPKVDDPAYGWIKRLKRVGQDMFAFVETVSDKIDQAIASGMFRKVSIALYADGLLRHVGLLGATPPAVKGLAPVEFATDKEFIEFTRQMQEEKDKDIRQVLADFFSSLFSDTQPRKNNQKQEDTMDSEQLKAMLAEQSAAMTQAFSDMIKPINAEITGIKETQAKIAADQAAQKVEFDKRFSESRHESGLRSFTAFCDDLIKQGKVLAGERDGLIEEFSDLQKAEGGMQFAQGEKTLTAKLMERLSARPAATPSRTAFAVAERASVADIDPKYRNFADKEIDPMGVQIDQEIQAYMEKNKVTYEEAASAYSRG